MKEKRKIEWILGEKERKKPTATKGLLGVIFFLKEQKEYEVKEACQAAAFAIFPSAILKQRKLWIEYYNQHVAQFAYSFTHLFFFFSDLKSNLNSQVL